MVQSQRDREELPVVSKTEDEIKNSDKLHAYLMISFCRIEANKSIKCFISASKPISDLLVIFTKETPNNY